MSALRGRCERRGGESAATVRRRGGRWSILFVALLLSGLSSTSVARADEKTVVPGANERWRQRFVAALDRITRRNDLSGLALIEEALEDESDTLVVAPVSRPANLDELRTALEKLGQVGGSDALTRRFVRPRTLALDCLDLAPREVLDAYRARTSGFVARLLAEHELTGERRPIERAALTLARANDAGVAIEKLADRSFESGRHREACGLYLELIDLPDAPREAVERAATKAVLASASVGDGFLDAWVRSTVAPRFGDVAEVRAALERISRRVPQASLPEASRWGGEIEAGSLPALPGKRLELSWQSWAWGDGDTIVRPDRQREALRPFHQRQLGQGFGFDLTSVDYPFVPLVDEDGSVWISGVYHLYAIDGRPGVGRVVREVAKPDPKRLRSTATFRERSESPIYAVSRWRRSRDEFGTGLDELARKSRLPREIVVTHYAADLVPAVQFYGHFVTQEIAVRALVAYDAETGEVLWKTTPRDASARDSDTADETRPDRRGNARPRERAVPEPFDPRFAGEPPGVDGGAYAPTEIPADFCVSSPPLVRHGRVYVGGWSEEGFVHAHVRALDLETGRTLWQTHVASSSLESTLFGEIAREPFASFLVERNGTLYFQSNLGAVAALEAESGKLLWVTTYDTIRVPLPDAAIPELRTLVWSARPPLLLGHLLIVTPRDSYSLLAIDTGTGPRGETSAGRILWTHDNEDGDLRDLLGYAKGRLFFSGRAGVGYLDLAGIASDGSFSADAGAPNGAGTGGGNARAEARAKVDPRRSPARPREVLARGWRRESVPAAGALCDRGVIVADETGIQLVDFDLALREPLLVDPLPRSPHGDFAGRVTIAGGLVFVTSNGLLSAFAAAEPAGDP